MKQKQAFTMVELTLAIVVLGILAGIAIPKLFLTKEDVELTKLQTQHAIIQNAMSLQKTDNYVGGRNMPTNLGIRKNEKSKLSYGFTNFIPNGIKLANDNDKSGWRISEDGKTVTAFIGKKTASFAYNPRRATLDCINGDLCQAITKTPIKVAQALPTVGSSVGSSSTSGGRSSGNSGRMSSTAISTIDNNATDNNATKEDKITEEKTVSQVEKKAEEVAQKIEADRLAEEKAKAEADRIAAEKAKAEAEEKRIAKEKAKAEATTKAEAEEAQKEAENKAENIVLLRPNTNNTSTNNQNDSSKVVYDEKQWPNLAHLDTARNVDYLTDLEKDIILEQNMVRNNPRLYAELYIKPRLNWTWSDNAYIDPSNPKVKILTKEGKNAVIECINDMLKITSAISATPLVPAQDLKKASNDHVKDQSITGQTGHTGSDNSTMSDRIQKYAGENYNYIGENIAYGSNSARDIIIQLLIDDGVEDRGHRRLILEQDMGDKDLTHVGLSVGEHTKYGKMCVINYGRSNINSNISASEKTIAGQSATSTNNNSNAQATAQEAEQAKIRAQYEAEEKLNAARQAAYETRVLKPLIEKAKGKSFEYNGKVYFYSEDLGWLNWEDAKKKAESYAEGYRLPTKDEMQAIYKSTYPQSIKPNIDDKRYWTSSPAGEFKYWNKEFIDGQNDRWWTCPPSVKHRVIAVKVLPKEMPPIIDKSKFTIIR